MMTTKTTVSAPTAPTTEQWTAILRRAVPHCVATICDTGLRLTHEQRDEIGDEGHDWLCQRLGLAWESDYEGVTYGPRSTGDGESES